MVSHVLYFQDRKLLSIGKRDGTATSLAVCAMEWHNIIATMVATQRQIVLQLPVAQLHWTDCISTPLQKLQGHNTGNHTMPPFSQIYQVTA